MERLEVANYATNLHRNAICALQIIPERTLPRNRRRVSLSDLVCQRKFISSQLTVAVVVGQTPRHCSFHRSIGPCRGHPV